MATKTKLFLSKLSHFEHAHVELPEQYYNAITKCRVARKTFYVIFRPGPTQSGLYSHRLKIRIYEVEKLYYMYL